MIPEDLERQISLAEAEVSKWGVPEVVKQGPSVTLVEGYLGSLCSRHPLRLFSISMTVLQWTKPEE
jgi:hypothetical protein